MAGALTGARERAPAVGADRALLLGEWRLARARAGRVRRGGQPRRDPPARRLPSRESPLERARAGVRRSRRLRDGAAGTGPVDDAVGPAGGAAAAVDRDTGGLSAVRRFRSSRARPHRAAAVAAYASPCGLGRASLERPGLSARIPMDRRAALLGGVCAGPARADRGDR